MGIDTAVGQLISLVIGNTPHRRIPGWEEMGVKLDDEKAGIPLVGRTLPERPRGPKVEGNWIAPAVKGGWMEIN